MAQNNSWDGNAMDLDREDSPVTVRGDNTPPLYRIDDDDDNDNDVAAEVVDLDFGEDLPGLNAGDFLTDDQFRAMFPQCTRPDRERDAVETQYTIAEAYNRNGEIWRSGTTVELRDGDFMKIIDVLEGSNNEIFLRGRRFRRTSRLRGLLDQHLNELLMLVEYTEHTPLEDIPPAADVQTIPASDAIKTRDLILTNETYPTYSYKEDRRNRGLPRAIAREECRLICRWKILLKYRKKGVRKVWAERCLARLRSEEADYGWRSRDNNLRAEWRGETIRRGSCLSWLAGEKAFDVAEQSRNRGVDILGFRRQSASSIQQLNGQRYTFGDAFCGAGGMSRGAKGAGLRVVWGVDFDPAAIDSYSKNFFEAKCEAAPADVFAMSIDGDYLVDILHLSPPCQPFSPIHTREGKDDEMNSSSLFAVGELLRKTKPRIATLENTFGLVERWEPWLNALVRVFTALGFSVRWRVLDLAAYGVPQARRRLILIASCPGEKLPHYPQPTNGPGRERYTTINDAIGRIPVGFPNHDIAGALKRNVNPYNGDLPLRNCITTTGSVDVHPSGQRGFTTRELLCLQSFPLEHLFGKAKVKKQAGNAVPPLFALVLLGHIRKCLEEADR